MERWRDRKSYMCTLHTTDVSFSPEIISAVFVNLTNREDPDEVDDDEEEMYRLRGRREGDREEVEERRR